MDFQNYLKNTAEQINQQLQIFYTEWRGDVKGVNENLLSLVDLSIEATEGGKRLRGGLVKLGYEIALDIEKGHKARGIGGVKEILKAAAAYEIFQTAILAHDDIIDKSPTRRGRATIYQKLGADHYAISQTICLGDIGFFLAFQILAESNFDADKKSKAMAVFAKSMLDTGFGQMLDVYLPSIPGPKQEKDVLTVSKYKTAWYTIVGPLSLGANLAGADKGLLEDLREFGENLGIAYQIQDDILGVFGDEKELGKSVTSDIEEGKNTLLIVQAIKIASDAQQEYLQNHYGKGKATKEIQEEIKQIFIKTKALDYAQNKAQKYVKKAKKVIQKITTNKNHKKLLNEMADFLINRSK